MPSNCQPLSLAQQNRSVCEDILFDCLTSLPKKTIDNGLFLGLSGQLLFQLKLSNYKPQWIDELRFSQDVESLQQGLIQSPQEISLSSGLCGQGWFLEYLNQYQSADYYPELCVDIDRILYQTINVETWNGEIEAVTGLGGFSIYAARRARKSSQLGLFTQLLKHYQQLAIITKTKTVSWPQPYSSCYRIDKENQDKHEFNLGLAHGVPGIIAALLPMLEIYTLRQSASQLITHACEWLLEQQIGPEKINSYFSNDNNTEVTSRLGWCYGDLTIALTLARVAKALDKPKYMAMATEISLYALHRNKDSGFIDDCGLCHGSAGLALIFQLLANLLEEPRLLDGANTWFYDVLKQYKYHGLQGLNRYCNITKVHIPNHGFLMGYSGIGLSILSALTADTDWVDCLLLE